MSAISTTGTTLISIPFNTPC